eukprot:6304995-Prymnesium_polylepis.1
MRAPSRDWQMRMTTLVFERDILKNNSGANVVVSLRKVCTEVRTMPAAVAVSEKTRAVGVPYPSVEYTSATLE